MEEIYNRYKDNPNVAIFLVNVGWENKERINKFIKKNGYKFPIAIDHNSQSFKLFGLQRTPSSVIIDKHNNIRIKHSNYDRSENIISIFTNHIDQLLSEK